MKEKKKFKVKVFRANVKVVLAGLVFLEVIVIVFLAISAALPNLNMILAAVGQDNVTVTSLLEVGNSFPEIINITINNQNPIDLTPNGTTSVVVVAVLRDYNGEGDIENVTSEFFDVVASSYGAADDNNTHYTNKSCTIDLSYGDSTEANATCIFPVQYYANNATWNATVFVNDSLSSSSTNSQSSIINTLLALGLPDSINYGTVNATFVSNEQEANVTNFGNVVMNLSLSGYGASQGDGHAMNCTLGSVQNISIGYEKYNVTSSNSGLMSLTHFDGNYTNLTSSPAVNEFNLNYRQNDTTAHVDDTNSTYWRVYVPIGVAGSCSGNIVFGAVQAPAT